MREYPVSQIFGPTIQGEGPLIGTPTLFFRIAGCDFDHCTWCDTLYAVNPKYEGWMKTMMTAPAICEQLKSLGSVRQVTMSGGNPALFFDYDLAEELSLNGFYVTMETQGSKSPPIMALRHPVLRNMVISPKPPSSGMSANMNPAVINEMIYQRRRSGLKTFLKYVVFDELDLQWIEWFDRMIDEVTTERCLSAGTTPNRILTDDELSSAILAQTRWLIDRVQGYDYFMSFRVLPQLHALLWGRNKGV